MLAEMAGTETNDEPRILVLPATRKDGEAMERVFRGARIATVVCQNLPDLCNRIGDGIAAALVTQEQVRSDLDERLARALAAQPRWSDLPVIVLTPAGSEALPEVINLASRHNVVLVQRPTQLATFLSTVKSAIRDRRRQYAVRDHLEEHQRHIAALADADRRKDEFLAILAHELRNPLAPIRTGVDCLLADAAGDLSDEQHVLPMMSRQINQMVRLIDDLLDVSRISRGKLSLSTATVDLAEVIRSAIETARVQIESSGQQLLITMPAERVWLNADAVRLSQVFSNLLNNSAKYSDAGGRIDLIAEVCGDRAVIRVKDTGVGIPREMLTTIFEMFTQVGSALERSRGGLGIGLTLVKSLVELHGGQISASSAGLGRGSEFTVSLPIVRTRRTERAAQQNGKYSGPPLRIVIADDNVDAASMLASFLTRMGQTTQTAHDGPTAVEAVCRLVPDLAIIDIGMPGMNGYEVAERLRNRLPAEQPVYLAALTGWGQEEDRRKAIAAGFDSHLVKPVMMSTLVTLLESVSVRGRVTPSD